MIERILVPMDGSRQASKALDWAIDVAQKYNAHIMILRVVTLSMLKIGWSTPGTGGPVIKQDFLKEADRRDRKTMNRIRKYLREKAESVSARGIESSWCVMVGDPADSIKACCKKEKIDLVVMNTHGKGWLKRAIMGSVTDEILRTSKVPVLVIRPTGK
ncbi:MAG: universal stress protein [Dehalococcoidales bacterium]|nr:universal stress protein [Dehalococcoidales bacterium]